MFGDAGQRLVRRTALAGVVAVLEYLATPTVSAGACLSHLENVLVVSRIAMRSRQAGGPD